MNKHLEEVYLELNEKYYYQSEFLQAVYEFFESIDEVVRDNSEIEETNIIRRMVEADRIISFKVLWEDDKGRMQVNKGYRVQFNQAIGPYKGGLRFHPSVNESILKFLAFEQILKNSLTGLPLGGAKGGSDFDPKGKSDREIRRFCTSFMNELYKYIGPTSDVPAGDMGVSAREIGYLFGQYKKLTNLHHGVITSKSPTYGGSLGRKEATGYGLSYITNAALLKYFNTDLKDKRVIISGSGNVGINASIKVVELGARVVAISDTSGVIIDDAGLDLCEVKRIKEEKLLLKEYLEKYPHARYERDLKLIWQVPCDVALPCARENELEINDAKYLVNNKVMTVLEGANMPVTKEATSYLIGKGILFVPGKLANAGGVVVSNFEMVQNATHSRWSFEEVDEKLKSTMETNFNEIYRFSLENNFGKNILKAANIKSFINLKNAMIEQGL